MSEVKTNQPFWFTEEASINSTSVDRVVWDSKTSTAGVKYISYDKVYIYDCPKSTWEDFIGEVENSSTGARGVVKRFFVFPIASSTGGMQRRPKVAEMAYSKSETTSYSVTVHFSGTIVMDVESSTGITGAMEQAKKYFDTDIATGDLEIIEVKKNDRD